MKFKILGLSFLLLYICCSSNPDKIPEIVSQRSVYFHNISFTDIWTATENSFGNINFTVTEKIREKGLELAIIGKWLIIDGGKPVEDVESVIRNLLELQ